MIFDTAETLRRLRAKDLQRIEANLRYLVKSDLVRNGA